MRFLKLFILILFLGGNSPLIFGQNDWHTDPYPLNENIDILKYVFELKLYDETDKIEGNASIQFRIKSKESVLALDLVSVQDSTGMSISNIRINDKNAEYTHENDRILITCPEYSGNDTIITAEISYSGVPGDGLIISENKFGERSFFGDNWPDRARNWLPCVDHVSDKALVEFVVYAPAKYRVVSNGHLYREYDIDENRRISHWRSNVPLPTKVMVIGVANFAFETAGYAANVPVQTWVYPQNINEGFYDYAPAVEVVEYFSGLLGDYSFEKLANVQSKTVYGGMENSGCIFYYENSVSGEGKVESLLTHEIAHQWFGDAVTEKDWHHIWLSEGFATYLTSVYMDEYKGRRDMGQSMKRSRDRIIQSYHNNPVPVIDTSIIELRKLLSTNSYQKGAWVLHMLRQELGEKLFWDGMRLYYKRFRNGNALSEDFRICMEEVSGRSLDFFFYQWLEVAGQPELAVNWEWWPESNTMQIVCRQLQDQHLFRFPLEIKVVYADQDLYSDTTFRISEKSQILLWALPKTPDKLIVDPDVKLLMDLK